MPYWDDGFLFDDKRRQDGWQLSPAFRASITADRNVAQCGNCETLLLGRRHWGRRGRHRPGLLAAQDPRAREQSLPYWEMESNSRAVELARSTPSTPKL